MDGFLLINKPAGILSMEVVNHYQKTLKAKMGHGGTLDPLASGLLIILIGNATKLSWLIQSLKKGYCGEAKLGLTTDSYDRSGLTIKRVDNINIDVPTIKHAMKKLKGEILQVPPPFSAVKIKGQRSYKLARNGIMVKKKPRKVMVYHLQLEQFKSPTFSFKALVGKGCYIRSLVYDLGQKLNCGATLWALQRTSIGDFELADARDYGTKAKIHKIDQLLNILPRINLSAEKIDELINGSSIKFSTASEEKLYYVTDGERMIVGYYHNNRLNTKRVIVK